MVMAYNNENLWPSAWYLPVKAVTYNDGKIYYDTSFDITKATFTLIRNTDPESKFFLMYLLKNNNWCIIKEGAGGDLHERGINATRSYMDVYADNSYWDIKVESDGTWTVNATKYPYGYGILRYDQYDTTYGPYFSAFSLAPLDTRKKVVFYSTDVLVAR